MWTADKWTEYKVLDCSGGEKLEYWAGYTLVRPDPQVIWKSDMRNKAWRHPDARYHRSSKGGGEWEFFSLPDTWELHYTLGSGDAECGMTFHLKPFAFKHTGVFPEQAVNWEYSYNAIRSRRAVQRLKGEEKPIKVLNLFAYTGGATMAAALAGAEVVHVDASRGMVNWARENAASSGLSDAPIRWIVDDCRKFAEREIRRGRRYDAIIMDPPSYGRGPGGEVWKMEESIFPFLKTCAALLCDNPIFVILNSYTTGLQPGVLTYMMELAFGGKSGGRASASEIGLPVEENPGLVLPEGATGRFEYDK